jgi:hypothetical protein
VLEARLDIYSATSEKRVAISRHPDCVRAADGRLMCRRRTEDVTFLEAPLTPIDEAQRLAGQLNQDANALATEARRRSAMCSGALRNLARAVYPARYKEV